MKKIDQTQLLDQSIYIVGHKKPDLDAVASAFAYQQYRKSRGNFNYFAITCDYVNSLTKWAFNEFSIDIPMMMKNVSNHKIVLVDHTDPAQRPDGWESAEIVEVLDHHKLKLRSNIPPKITIRPYGSTCTIIAQKMLISEDTISKELAGLMLSAIIDDTLALRSPITTDVDRAIAGELSSISKISDLGNFSQLIFNQKDNWSNISAQKIVNSDTKNYLINNKRIRIAQVETMNNKLIEPKSNELIAEMGSEVEQNKLDLFLVMLTDLISNNCILLSTGAEEIYIEEIFDRSFSEPHKIYLPGVLSRKKQIVPKLYDFYASHSSKKR